MEIIIIICLILLNGVFSMSEIALVAAKKYRMQHAAKKGNKNARRALNLAENPNHFLSTVQMGITLIAILTGVFSSDDMQRNLQEKLSAIEFLQGYESTLAIVIIVGIVTFCSIVFGELVPKRIGLMFPEKISYVMAMPMNILSWLTAPFVWLLTSTNDLIIKIFGIKPRDDNKVTEADIRSMIRQSAQGGDVQEIERHIVERVFSLGDRRVSELMTHRTNIVWLNINAATDDLRSTIRGEVHSVYPVCDGDLDKLLGIINMKDMLAYEAEINSLNITRHLKKPLVLHDNTPAYRALEAFRRAKLHYAIVVDEYGSVTGMVSMDDVLDALVGDVSEMGQEDYQIVKRKDGTWIADGQYPYFELLHYFTIPEDTESHDFNTVAGLILDMLGRMPKEGDSIDWQSYTLEIIDIDGLRIDKVLIKKRLEE